MRGGLFEGIVQREMAGYIIRTKCVDFPSSGEGYLIWGDAVNHGELFTGSLGTAK
jgi:hypothetical protein